MSPGTHLPATASLLSRRTRSGYDRVGCPRTQTVFGLDNVPAGRSQGAARIEQLSEVLQLILPSGATQLSSKIHDRTSSTCY
jgi:hypothetical protein